MLTDAGVHFVHRYRTMQALYRKQISQDTEWLHSSIAIKLQLGSKLDIHISHGTEVHRYAQNPGSLM